MQVVQCSKKNEEVTSVVPTSPLPTVTVTTEPPSVEIDTPEYDFRHDAMVEVAEQKMTTTVAPTTVPVEQTSVQVDAPMGLLAESTVVETAIEAEYEVVTEKIVTREDLKQRNKTVKSLIKSLGKFDGTDSFEIFQMQLELIARIGNWNEHDLLCHLMTSLSGKAAEVLLCLKDSLSYDEAIDRLRRCFVVEMEPDQARVKNCITWNSNVEKLSKISPSERSG